MNKTRMIFAALSLMALAGAANASAATPVKKIHHKPAATMIHKAHVIKKLHKVHPKHAMIKKVPAKAKAV